MGIEFFKIEQKNTVNVKQIMWKFVEHCMIQALTKTIDNDGMPEISWADICKIQKILRQYEDRNQI